MRVSASALDWQKAREVHERFSAKTHSEHIASEFALAHLAAVLRTNEIKSVLEFGAGIGTMTYLLLSTLPESATVESTEANELCLAVLGENLPPEGRDRLIVHAEGSPPSERAFDLVIIDGDITPGSDFLERGSLCFAEGNRSKARKAIELSLNARGLTCRFTNHLPSEDKKGCWIGRIDLCAAS